MKYGELYLPGDEVWCGVVTGKIAAYLGIGVDSVHIRAGDSLKDTVLQYFFILES
jgi:hypothetical protein